MPVFTLNQAAKVAKRSKSTLYNAIHSGALPASRDNKNRWQIESEELFRIYPKTSSELVNKTGFNPRQPNNETIILRQHIAFLEQKINFLEQQTNHIKNERDDLLCHFNEKVDNLTALVTKILNESVAPLSYILNLTPSQCRIFIMLYNGLPAIREHYGKPLHQYLSYAYDGSDMLYMKKIIEGLMDYGVLNRDGKVSDVFKKITTNILQRDGIDNLTVYELLQIAKEYNEKCMGLKKVRRSQ